MRLALKSPDAMDAAPRVVAIERAQVKLEEQAARSRVIEIERDGLAWKIGVIELPTFYSDFGAMHRGERDYKSSTRDVAELVAKLSEEGVDGIVVDLRDNGGGSLNEAQALSGLFLGQSSVVQVRDAKDKVQVLVNRRPALWDGPLTVLVNRLSASASEIFAAAIQDYGRGLVVGSSTFGKGTVQSIVPIGEGQLKVTQARFYRVSGASTQHRGVQPDIEFPSVYDPDEIGESALDDALPWDQIAPVKYAADGAIQRELAYLVARHGERTALDPAFDYYRQRRELIEEASARTSVSLNEAARRAERDGDEARLLAIENARRAAEGEEPLASLDERPLPNPHADEKLDPYAREAAELLVDSELAPRKATPRAVVSTGD